MNAPELLQLRKRTHIVATVGPACRSPEKLTELAIAGVDVFRLNMAHDKPEGHDVVVGWIEQIRQKLGRPIAILADLAGPKIRLGGLTADPTYCAEGQEFVFVRGDKAHAPDQLTCTYERLVDELTVGDRVMLADGVVSLSVIAKEHDSVRCCVTSPGEIRTRQGVNLPGAKLTVPAMTEEDLINAEWAGKRKIDFVGLSFVRSPDEIIALKKLLESHGSKGMVVAKIEKPEAVERLEEIVSAADAVMVARGDLGVEIDVATTPVVQKRIIETCNRLFKPVIVATQMLESMKHSRHPSRAEVTDVANAILDGADACMLSGETAVGDHPAVVVEMMVRIIISTEQLLIDTPQPPPPDYKLANVNPITAAAVYGAGEMADLLQAKLVCIASHGGKTALVKSKQRQFTPVVAVGTAEETLRHMCLFWGVTPLQNAPVNDGPMLRQFIEKWGKSIGLLVPGDRIVFLTGSGFYSRAHNLVIVHEVE